MQLLKKHVWVHFGFKKDAKNNVLDKQQAISKLQRDGKYYGNMMNLRITWQGITRQKHSQHSSNQPALTRYRSLSYWEILNVHER